MASDGGLDFRNLETLFGQALTERRRRDLQRGRRATNEARACRLVTRRCTRFLGVPLFDGSELIGMFGVANRPGGYDDELVAYLEPFTGATSGLIRAYRSESRRRSAEQAEREARLAAERASAQKTEFLARFSHELRTPLHAILGFAELLADGATDAADREHTGVIVDAATHLTGLVDELFEVARIERGRIPWRSTTSTWSRWWPRRSRSTRPERPARCLALVAGRPPSPSWPRPTGCGSRSAC